MIKIIVSLLILIPAVYGAEENIQFTYESLKVEFEVNEGTNSVKLNVVDQKDKDKKPKEKMMGLVTYSDEKRRQEFFEAVAKDLRLIKGDIEKGEDKPKKEKKFKKEKKSPKEDKWTKEEIEIAVGQSFVEHLSLHGPIRGKIDLKGERLKNYWQQRDKKKKKKKARANIPTNEEHDGVTKVADGNYYRSMTRKKDCVPKLGSNCEKVDAEIEKAVTQYLKVFFNIRKQQVEAGNVNTRVVPPEIRGYRQGLNKRIADSRKECNCLENGKRIVEKLEKDWEESTSRMAANIALNGVRDVWLEYGLVPELSDFIVAKAIKLDSEIYSIYKVPNSFTSYPGTEAGNLLHYRIQTHTGELSTVDQPPWENLHKPPAPIIDNKAETVQ